MEVVTDKVKDYDPTKTGEETSDFTETESVGVCTIYSKYVPCAEQLMAWIGVFSAILFSACLPGFCLFFGEMIDGVGGQGGGTENLK